MLIFINLSGGQNSWYVAPLMMLAPMLLTGMVNQLLGSLLAGILWLAGDEDSWTAFALEWLALGTLCAVLYFTLRMIRNTRAGGFLRQLLSTGMSGGAAAAAAGHAHRPGQQQQQQQTAQQRQQRWDKVVTTLQKLPMETVVTAAELEQETPHQLKQRLSKAGISCSGCLEKQELVTKVLDIGGSSGSSCSICYEDYHAGDVVRVLPCKHRYHIECVDRWFLSSTDYSRDPACPMCNESLFKNQQQ